jgi:hypothetical protein
MIILAWTLLIVGLGGIVCVVGMCMSNAKYRRRLKKMRDEADTKRDCYFVLSDKTDPKPNQRPRVRFLP